MYGVETQQCSARCEKFSRTMNPSATLSIGVEHRLLAPPPMGKTILGSGLQAYLFSLKFCSASSFRIIYCTYPYIFYIPHFRILITLLGNIVTIVYKKNRVESRIFIYNFQYIRRKNEFINPC